jgi:hypothetical protein
MRRAFREEGADKWVKEYHLKINKYECKNTVLWVGVSVHPRGSPYVFMVYPPVRSLYW